MGVDGATHHDFIPIIKALAWQQVDPDSGLKYFINSNNSPLKASLFGGLGFLSPPDIGNPTSWPEILIVVSLIEGLVQIGWSKLQNRCGKITESIIEKKI